MKVERVQKWVGSALILSTAAHLALALVWLGVTRPNPAAFPVLTGIATVMCLGAILGTRALNGLSLLTPWLLLGLLPIPLALFFR